MQISRLVAPLFLGCSNGAAVCDIILPNRIGSLVFKEVVMSSYSRIVTAGIIIALSFEAPSAGMEGATIFSDSFDEVGTFAENWVSKNCKSSNGSVRIPDGASMRWRGCAPLEFSAEAEITLKPSWSSIPPTKPFQARGGFKCAGHYFCVQPCGKAFMVWREEGQNHSDGRYSEIDGFAIGKPTKIRLVRKIAGVCGVKYCFSINDTPVYDFITSAPKPVIGADGQEGYAPVSLMAYKLDMEVDNFMLSAVRHDEDSPNTIYNSGFEYVEDRTPTHYGYLGYFNFSSWDWGKFGCDYLDRFTVDEKEKHSGMRSLRVKVNGASRSISIRPWRPGTVKGAAGVFSLWMKASEENLEVKIALDPVAKAPGADGSKVVDVGRTWQRYEVTRQSLAGRGVYSPISIDVLEPTKHDAVLWIDDLQLEMVSIPEGGFKIGQTYATSYRASELDKNRFGTKRTLSAPRALTVFKLPDGIRPSVMLDRWRNYANIVDEFWVGAIQPARKTEAQLACDDNYLYIGVRNFGEPAERVNAASRGGRDKPVYMSDSLELFLRPNSEFGYYHLACAANGDQLDLYNNDLKWDGQWEVATKYNATAEAMDYLVKIPFSDVSMHGVSSSWRVNICRNDYATVGAEQCISSAKTETPNFRQEDRWNSLALPAEVVSRWSTKYSHIEKESREEILGRLDYYMDEDFAQWRITDINGKMDTVKKPLSEIPFGTNAVSFSVNGKTYSDIVVKLPYRKGATQVNRWTRSLVHDGRNELFTGIGIGCTGYFGYKKGFNPFVGMFDMLKADGFRHFLFMASSRAKRMEEARACLDALRVLE